MSANARSDLASPSLKSVEAALDDITARGVAAIRDAKANVEDVFADVADKGQQTLKGARQARDSLDKAILRSIRTRPYTTLAIAGGLGFLYGALRRR
jgi:ElaB/YqjD/DUF883 family membrane-anchored ribosome-binding protein